MIAIAAIVLVILIYSIHTSYKSEKCITKDKRKIIDTFKGFRRMRHIYDEFELWEMYDILTDDECKKIIKISEERGFKKSRDSSYSTNKTAWISNIEEPLVEHISRLTQNFTDLPIENQEDLQVAKYEKGGVLVPHFDRCTGGKIAAEKRICTFLIYLNEDFKGGETYFPNIGLSIRPKRGKAILFWTRNKNLKIYEEALHQGMQVLEGEKYICTKWSHLSLNTEKY